MHPSYFLALNTQESSSKKELTLLEGVSEWLFYTKFWEEFNQKHKTLFQQYEEEVLTLNLMTDMVTSLSDLITEVDQQSESNIQFRYGWNELKEELICIIEKGKIIDELNKLILFMELASTVKSEVYCQL